MFFLAPIPLDPSLQAQSASGAARRLLPRSVYPLRVLGMGLGGLPVLSVLYERQAPVLQALQIRELSLQLLHLGQHLACVLP